MRTLITGLSIFLSASAIAGGSMGGGTPPSLQDLQQDLVLKPDFDGGLFNKNGEIGLLTRKALQPQMLVASGMGDGTLPASAMQGGSSGAGVPPALRLSDADFAVLRDRMKPIHALDADGANASYSVEAGDSIDSVILKDRRETARESVKQ